MYVEEIKHRRNGKIYTTVLVRESYREGKSVRHRTISNISDLPKTCIQQIKDTLKGESSHISKANTKTPIWLNLGTAGIAREGMNKSILDC